LNPSLILNWNAGWTSGVTTRLYDVSPDIAGTNGASGAPLPLTFSSPGQNARPAFTGAAGFRVSLRTVQSTSTIIASNLAILKPDNTNLATATLNSSSFIEPSTLPVNGVYTVLVDPLYNKRRAITRSRWTRTAVRQAASRSM